MIYLVKIHGNWCGPNWTGGQKVSAQDYQGDWNYPAVSKLDRACRVHDRDCSHTDGCSSAADRKLAKVALAISTNWKTRLFQPNLAKAAERIYAVMLISQRTRRR